MTRRALFSAIAASALAVTGAVAAAPAVSASVAPPSTHTTHVCKAPVGDNLECMAIAVADVDGKIVSSMTPLDAAFTPTDVQAAYNLKGLKSGGRTVAIVDAYGYPTLEADLKVYRSTYGLPPCTTANGCLTIMNQDGGSKPPPTDPGWDLEQALDVDSVSATCPDCKILVVQAINSSGFHLRIAVNRAAMQKGVVAISNSYGGKEPRRTTKDFNHKGIAITASTGDSGWQGGSYPASHKRVVAVGGTSVHRSADDSRGYTENAWSGAGSGCSTASKAPGWQKKKVKTTCKTRAMSDVSAAADPNYGGLSIYFNGRFMQVGGTSEASPIIAAVYALSGNTKNYPAKIAYEKPGGLYDITTGSNGACGPPICTAGKGWDGPTGMGTPNGVKSF